MIKFWLTSFQSELFGEIKLIKSKKGVERLIFEVEDSKDELNSIYRKGQVIEDITKFQQEIRELGEYLRGERNAFTFPVNLQGTAFQQRVWQELQKIPYGEVISYKELAIRVGSPKGFRAVGGANGKNPVPIIVPCHRVVNEGGKLGGYSSGLEVKKKLLHLEGAKLGKGS